MLTKNKIRELLRYSMDKQVLENDTPFIDIVVETASELVEPRCTTVWNFGIKYQTTVYLQDGVRISEGIQKKVVDMFWRNMYGDVTAKLEHLVYEMPYRKKEDIQKELEKIVLQLKGE